MPFALPRPWGALLWVPLFACDGGDPVDTDTPLAAVCDEPTDVGCIDSLLVDLSLQTTVSNGAVSNREEGGVWISDVDATAGGVSQAQNNPWVYVKFTDNGLEKVAIDDESALESMEWHLSARRFVLRLNGGSSGPSCVGAFPLADATFDAVTVADAEGLTYFQDDYFTPTCTLINDSSGLPGSPQVALGPWWTYPNCVATSDIPFIIRLDSGRRVKFVVQRYYGSQQQQCNTSSVPGTDGGSFRFRWAFLD